MHIISNTTRKSAFHLFLRHPQNPLASARYRFAHIEPSFRASTPLRSVFPPPSSHKIIKVVITQIRRFLRLQLPLRHIEGFIHKCLDKALFSTPRHQRVYETVIVYLIRKMWPHPAASVYDRMSSKGFISSNVLHARMLAIVLADTRGSEETVLPSILDIVSNPDFSDQHFVAVLNVAEDYHLRPKIVVGLVKSFLRAKRTGYVPRRGIIAVWLRAAVKLRDVDLMRDILELGGVALRLSAIVEAWKVADNLGDCLQQLGMRLVGAVANPAVKETEFLRFLEVIKEVRMNVEIVAQVCASFLANRDKNYIPKSQTVRAAIEAFIQTDRVNEAFALLYRVGIQPGKRPMYRAFLANLRDSRPLDHHSFAKLLSAMDAAEMPLDTAFLNILISREVRRKRAVNALSMFSEMKKNPHLLPDSHTFGSLFAMYRRIRPRSVARYSGVKSMATPTHPLRELFRELVESSKRGKNPVRPNTPLFNAALKAFMRQRDYAGAIIVVSAFDLFQVPLDNKTYYYVVKLLVRRVWAEARASRPKNEERWVDRFLGVQHYCEIELSRSSIHGIFAVLRRKDFDLSMPLYLPKQPRGHRILHRLRRRAGEGPCHTFPTMEMMETLEQPEPADFFYDPVPLMRILSRAVYAEAVVPHEEAARRVERLVRRADGEMILDLA